MRLFTAALAALTIAATPARAAAQTMLEGDVSWQDLEAGYASINFYDGRFFLGSVTTDDGSAVIAADRHSVHYAIPYPPFAQSLQAEAVINTGPAGESPGPGIRVFFATSTVLIPAAGPLDIDLGFGLGRVEGTAAGPFAGTEVTGGTLRLDSHGNTGAGSLIASSTGQVDDGGTYLFDAAASTIDHAQLDATTDSGPVQLSWNPTGATIVRGETLTLDVPADAFVHVHGTVSWQFPVAGSATVTANGFDGGVMVGSGPLHLADGGLAGSYDLYVPREALPARIVVDVSTCLSLGCPDIPASSINVQVGEVPAGAAGSLDRSLALDYPPVPISGTVRIPEGELASGFVFIASQREGISSSTVVPIDLLDARSGTYHAEIGPGAAIAWATVEIAGCRQVTPNVPVELTVVEGVPVVQDLVSNRFNVDPLGSVDIVFDIPGFPANVYIVSAGLAGEFIDDCSGGLNSAGNIAFPPNTTVSLTNLTPGKWQAGPPFSLWALGSQATYEFQPVLFDVPPGPAPGRLVLGFNPAILTGNPDLSGWDVGPSDFLGTVEFHATSSAGAKSKSLGLPVGLFLDPGQSGWRTFGGTVAFYSYPDGGFQVMQVLVPEHAIDDVQPGETAFADAELLDITVGHLMVTDMRPAGADFFFVSWAPTILDADGRQISTFASTTVALQARLAPARYDATLDGGYVNASGFHQLQMPLSVELDERDQVTQHWSGPFVADRLPAPGPSEPDCGTAKVSATVTDPDGVADVRIAGRRVRVHRDGSVSAPVALRLGENAVEIEASDTFGATTSHVRLHDRVADVVGFFDPIDADLVPAPSPGEPPIFPPAGKPTELGKLAKLKLRIESCGVVVNDDAAYPHPPRIVRIERESDGTVLSSSAVDFDLDGGTWMYSLATTPLGTGKFLVTVQAPDDGLWVATLEVTAK